MKYIKSIVIYFTIYTYGKPYSLMVYGLAQSSMMWMLAFCCGWTRYPSALPSHLISDWALQTQQRPQRTFPFIVGIFLFFLSNSNLAGVRPKVWVWKHNWNARTLHESVWQEGRTNLESEKPVEGMQKAQRATTQTQISTFPSLWITHVTTMALEWLRENGQAHWDDIKVLKKKIKF